MKRISMKNGFSSTLAVIILNVQQRVKSISVLVSLSPFYLITSANIYKTKFLMKINV